MAKTLKISKEMMDKFGATISSFGQNAFYNEVVDETSVTRPTMASMTESDIREAYKKLKENPNFYVHPEWALGSNFGSTWGAGGSSHGSSMIEKAKGAYALVQNTPPKPTGTLIERAREEYIRAESTIPKPKPKKVTKNNNDPFGLRGLKPYYWDGGAADMAMAQAYSNKAFEQALRQKTLEKIQYDKEREEMMLGRWDKSFAPMPIPKASSSSIKVGGSLDPDKNKKLSGREIKTVIMDEFGKYKYKYD